MRKIRAIRAVRLLYIENKMSAKEKLNRAYLDTKINRILEPLIVAILNDKPEDHVSAAPRTPRRSST